MALATIFLVARHTIHSLAHTSRRPTMRKLAPVFFSALFVMASASAFGDSMAQKPATPVKSPASASMPAPSSSDKYGASDSTQAGSSGVTSDAAPSLEPNKKDNGKIKPKKKLAKTGTKN